MKPVAKKFAPAKTHGEKMSDHPVPEVTEVTEVTEVIKRALRETFPAFPVTERDTISPGASLRSLWTVTAGVIPNIIEPERTRRWCLTSETWAKENEMPDAEFLQLHPDGKSTYWKYRDAAYEYAASLNEPDSLNWVRVDWMWM